MIKRYEKAFVDRNRAKISCSNICMRSSMLKCVPTRFEGSHTDYNAPWLLFVFTAKIMYQ